MWWFSWRCRGKSGLARVAKGRGWGERELEKRENLQFSLDKKAKLADYCIDNTGDEASSLAQVQQVLSQILPTASELWAIRRSRCSRMF